MKDYELLEKQAAMMRMAEKYGVDWRHLVLVSTNKERGEWSTYSTLVNHIHFDNEHKFALGMVEGRPVFEGDTLWNVPNGFKFSAQVLSKRHQCTDEDFIIGVRDDKYGQYGGWVKDCSWNPPAPKTVMVELLVEDAKYWHKRKPNPNDFIGCEKVYREASINFYDAVGKALEANRG